MRSLTKRAALALERIRAGYLEWDGREDGVVGLIWPGGYRLRARQAEKLLSLGYIERTSPPAPFGEARYSITRAGLQALGRKTLGHDA